MFEAERHNKLGPELELATPRSEDLLTSSVFGTLKYLSQPAMLRVLESLIHGASWFSKEWPVSISAPVSFDFWPRLGPEGEMDLIIDTPQLIIGIEVKFHSTLHNRNLTDNQLARYSSALARKAQKEGRPACLVYMTMHARPPLEDLPGTVHHLEPDFAPSVSVLWISWLDFADAIQHLMGSDGVLTESDHTLLSDVGNLLAWRGLTHFRGFNAISLGPLNARAAWFHSKKGSSESWWPSASLPSLQKAWFFSNHFHKDQSNE